MFDFKQASVWWVRPSNTRSLTTYLKLTHGIDYDLKINFSQLLFKINVTKRFRGLMCHQYKFWQKAVLRMQETFRIEDRLVGQASCTLLKISENFQKLKKLSLLKFFSNEVEETFCTTKKSSRSRVNEARFKS